VLPCCTECNSFAGTVWPFNLAKRGEAVKEKLRKKYRCVLETPDWSSDEVRPLGYGLKSGVKSWMRLKKRVQNRLAWNVIAYLPSIGHGSDFARLNAEIDTMPGSERGSFEKQVRSWLVERGRLNS
jgi:hypothetical protein